MMRACSTAGGGVMFMEENIIRPEPKKKPMHYKDLVRQTRETLEREPKAYLGKKTTDTDTATITSTETEIAAA